MAQNIAIVGISAELPSGTQQENLNHEQFFEFLLDKCQAYEKIPSDRFNIQAWKGENLGQISTEKGSFLKDIDLFDNVEFGVSNRDARAMAPSTRKLIEQSFLALQDSGINSRSQNIGCFTAGVGYSIADITEPNEMEPRGSFASIPAMIANRVSYHLDLTGPSIPIDTACSSSCTALHLAVNALLCDDCDAAVVAGCQLNHRFLDWFHYSQGSVLSRDGKCKPFDASADGFSRAEAVVAIVIKRLDDALKDEDYIYANILGTAVNSSGLEAPPSAPVAKAQHLVMKRAFQRACRSPQEVDFVECHATGTARGDPEEVNWIGKAFGREKELIIGSVKGNIGHTEITSFLVSLSKVISMFQNQVIPPNVNLSTLNSEIQWETYKLHVPHEPVPLPCHSGRNSLVAICSSGIGGSNAHAVVESFAYHHQTDDCIRATSKSPGPLLLIVGGLSPRSASSLSVSVLAVAGRSPKELEDMFIDSYRRARQLPWRSFIVVEDRSNLPPKLPDPVLSPRTPPPIVFLFSGQGPQYKNMGKQLFQHFPAFRDSVLKSDAIYQARTGKSLIKDYGLFDVSFTSSLESWPIHLTLPALAVFQTAMFDLLIEIGIKPDVVMGHSAGETCVLYASGAGTQRMAIELAIARGEAFSLVEDKDGTMAALACNATRAMELIGPTILPGGQPPLDIACYNSPSAVAISGPESSIDSVLSLASAAGVWARKIKTRVPVHSSMMEHCRSEYKKLTAEVFRLNCGDHIPRTPTVSTGTGHFMVDKFDADYFWNSTRNPVRFTDAIASALIQHPNAIFIEISPHPVLSSYVSEQIPDASEVIPTARRSQGDELDTTELLSFLTMMGRLTLAGYNTIDLHRMWGTHVNCKTSLYPKYPFGKKRFPLYLDDDSFRRQQEARNGPLNHRNLKINQDTHPLLAEHIVRGEAVMPAAGFIEMALEFGTVCLLNVKLHSILPLTSETPIDIKVERDGCYWSISSVKKGTSSTPALENHLHADGYLSSESEDAVSQKLNIDQIKGRCSYYTSSRAGRLGDRWDSKIPDFYSSIAYALEYGPHFQRVIEIDYSRNEALAKIKGLQADLASDEDYILHPAILDACLHLTVFRPFHGNTDPNAYYLPSRFSKILLHKSPKKRLFPELIYAYYKLQKCTPDSLAYDIAVADELGNIICSFEDCEAARHRLDFLPSVTIHHELVYQPIQPSRPPQPEEIHLRSQENKHLPNESLFFECVQLIRLTMSRLCTEKAFIKVLVLNNEDFELDSELSQSLSGLNSGVTVSYYSLGGQVITSQDNETIYRHTLKANKDGSFDLQEHQSSFDMVLIAGTPSPFDKITSTLSLVHKLLLPRGSLHLLGPAEASWETIIDASFHTTLIRRSSSSVLLICEYLPQGHSSLFQATEEKTLTYWYTSDCEMNLQWFLSGVDPADEINLWILSKIGRVGDEATGLVRALRKEFFAWNVKMVLFPESFDEATALQHLDKIPSFSADDHEFIISANGDVLVPRIVSFPAVQTRPKSRLIESSNAFSTKIRIKVLSGFQFGGYSSIVGTTEAAIDSRVPNGALVGTLCLEQPCTETTINVDPALVQALHTPAGVSYEEVALAMPGLVIAALASSVSVFKRRDRMKLLRILVVDHESVIGQVVKHAYLSLNADIVHVRADIGLARLSRLGTFDVVLSSREDKDFAQFANTLLRKDSGRLWLWNEGLNTLPSVLRRDCCLVGDALESAIGLLPLVTRDITSLTVPDTLLLRRASPSEDHHITLFDSNKTYLLLGGLGSLGAHIALWMYQRGARHLILTSRTGLESLQSETNCWTLRMVNYLQSREDLHLGISHFDAGNVTELGKVIQVATPPVAGCFLLTTLNSDGIFMNLSERDFKIVRDASSGVLDSLRAVVQLEHLDFLISFSSVSALFGNGGQSNYSSAKCAMDGALWNLPNAFSFICPPIFGTSLVSTSQGIGLPSWNVSVKRMLQWLEDSIQKFQSGHVMSLYIPDLDWNALNDAMGPSKLTNHLLLLPKTGSNSTTESVSTLKDQLLSLALENLQVQKDEFSWKVPLLSYGLDSLSASRLSFSLKKQFSIEINQIQLLSNRISLQSLLDRLPNSHREDEDGLDETGAQITLEEGTDQILHDMRAMLSKYTASTSIYQRSPSPFSRKFSTKTILLTGATGILGSHILHQLLQDPAIGTIYVLIRVHPELRGLPRLERKFSEEGLDLSLLRSDKLKIMDFNMDLSHLGLSDKDYQVLLSSVDYIIHSAWTTDFTSEIDMLEDLIIGTRSLIDLSLSSKLVDPPKLFFISSIGACRFSETGTEEPISAQSLSKSFRNVRLAHMSGYIQSKWVAEQLINHFTETTPLKAAICRVGQLTGSRNGTWKTSQWVPAMVKSALFTNCLPDGKDTLAWIPVDVAATAIVEMLSDAQGTVHVVHPRPAQWEHIISEMARHMGVKTVPYHVWFQRLELSIETPELVKKYGANPAIRLLDFYRQGLSLTVSDHCPSESMGLIPKVNSEQGKKSSATLSNPDIPRLDSQDVEKWFKYWRAVGFLPDAK